MSEQENSEDLRIPDILLDIQGMRTSSREVDAATIVEAQRILEANRNIEAGIADILTNLIKNRRVTPEEVSGILNKIKSIKAPALPSTLPAGTINPAQAQHDAMIDFLEQLNNNTQNKFLHSPFHKGMNPNWKQLGEVADQAKAGAPGSFEAMQQAMGTTANGVENALKKYWRVAKWFTPVDEAMLNKQMIGVYKLGDHGQQIQITYKQFFEGAGSMNYTPGMETTGNIVMSSPDAVKISLSKLATTIGGSATLRGLAQTTATAAATVAAIPMAAGVAGTLWGFGQGMKNAPGQVDYDKALPGNSALTVDPSMNNNPASVGAPKTSPLGGTTNGNNIGGLGGQYSPKPNIGWTPTKPNLPSNPNDWLPTSPTDYYNLVDRKSDSENENIRLSQMASTPVDDVDTVVNNLLTILEQGAPGEATLQQALNYLSHEDSKAQPLIHQFQMQQNAQLSQAPTNNQEIPDQLPKR
jgi:hypothetical protein